MGIVGVGRITAARETGKLIVVCWIVRRPLLMMAVTRGNAIQILVGRLLTVSVGHYSKETKLAQGRNLEHAVANTGTVETVTIFAKGRTVTLERARVDCIVQNIIFAQLGTLIILVLKAISH